MNDTSPDPEPTDEVMLAWLRTRPMQITFLAILLSAFLAVGCSLPATQGRQPSKPNQQMISLEQLQEMFASMRRDAPFDVNGKLLWGYFFTDGDPEKLKPIRARLSASGYRIVRLEPTDDGSTHILHVERIERHTPESLHARNQEFYRLASEFGIESYDGMDVGPVEQPE